MNEVIKCNYCDTIEIESDSVEYEKEDLSSFYLCSDCSRKLEEGNIFWEQVSKN